MATLRAGVAGILEGRGGVVSIIADAGLGKSRLIAELMGSDQAAEVTWLEGRSLSTGRNLSFHPFADLARSFAGVADEDDEAQAREKLQSAVGGLLPDEADQVVPFLAQLLGMPLEPGERELLERIPRDNMERMLRSAVTQLLRRGAELTPLVIVMDDLHWADQSSIELLGSLLRLATEHRILFLHVFRPAYAETSERVLALAREQYTDLHAEVLLDPLGPEAARELVRNLFKEGDIPHAIRTMIEEKAQGNPFYIEEVVRALLDEGAVVLQYDRFQATDKIHSVVIPDTVHEVIAARVDRLELARRQLLQTAAVVGGSFHLDVLLQVARGPEGTPGELDADLEALIDAEFIVPYDRSQGIEYAFKHPLIQEVTYDALLQTRREQLHLSVAEAILASLPEDLVGYNGMLAYHFSKGRDSERAEDYLFRAGDEAARFAASSEALDLFRQASDLYVELHGDGGDPRKRALLEKNMGFALFHRGQLIESVDRFGKALEHLGIRIPRGDLALQLRFARDMLAILVHLYLPGIDRKRPAATDVQREAIEIMFNRGLAQTTTAPTRFVFDTMSSLRWLMRLDPSTIPESGGKYAGSVGIWSYGGVSFSLGRKFLDLAKPLIPQETAPDYLYYRLLNFIHHMLQGDWSEEHEIGEAVLERNLREGRLWDVTTYLGLEAEKRIRRGQFDRVRERLDQIDDIWERFEYDLAKTNHYWLPTCLRLEQRRLDEAVSAAEIYYDENPEDLLHVLALGSKAAAQSLAGEDDEGVEKALDKAEAIVARSGPVFPFHLSCYRGARFAADVRRLEVAGPLHGSSRRDLERRARRSGRAAISTSKKVAYRQPEIFRMAGRLAWLRGKQSEALGWWTRSLEVADRLGLQPERARTQQEAGQRLQDAPNGVGSFLGLEAKGHLEEAGAAFDRLGLAWDLERLEAGSVT
jgi:tetratricopeptide (TPR) repeat protein